MASILALAAPALAGEVSAPRAEALSYLVRQDCGSCHGMTLRGGLGRPLLPASLADDEAGAIAEVILDGIPGTPMPPWRGLLNEAEALWIAHALKEGRIE
jgi:cytochrome c55X